MIATLIAAADGYAAADDCAFDAFDKAMTCYSADIPPDPPASSNARRAEVVNHPVRKIFSCV